MAPALLALLPSVVDVVKKFIPDRSQQDAAIAEINQTFGDAAAKVGDAMIIDAQSTSFFRGGWRPALGWICVSGLAVHYLAFPFIFLGMDISSPLDVGSLMSLVATLLGLGGLRTVERIKGKA